MDGNIEEDEEWKIDIVRRRRERIEDGDSKNLKIEDEKVINGIEKGKEMRVKKKVEKENKIRESLNDEGKEGVKKRNIEIDGILKEKRIERKGKKIDKVGMGVGRSEDKKGI